jgi:hypothetical protein
MCKVAGGPKPDASPRHSSWALGLGIGICIIFKHGTGTGSSAGVLLINNPIASAFTRHCGFLLKDGLIPTGRATYAKNITKTAASYDL